MHLVGVCGCDDAGEAEGRHEPTGRGRGAGGEQPVLPGGLRHCGSLARHDLGRPEQAARVAQAPPRPECGLLPERPAGASV